MKRAFTSKFCEWLEDRIGKWCRVLYFDHRKELLPFPPSSTNNPDTEELSKGNTAKESAFDRVRKNIKSRKMQEKLKKEEYIKLIDSIWYEGPAKHVKKLQHVTVYRPVYVKKEICSVVEAYIHDKMLGSDDNVVCAFPSAPYWFCKVLLTNTEGRLIEYTC